MSLKIFEMLSCTMFFLSFSLLLIIDHLRLRMWVVMEDWKKNEEESADERRWATVGRR